jgi:hypothetical protein
LEHRNDVRGGLNVPGNEAPAFPGQIGDDETSLKSLPEINDRKGNEDQQRKDDRQFQGGNPRSPE